MQSLDIHLQITMSSIFVDLTRRLQHSEVGKRHSHSSFVVVAPSHNNSVAYSLLGLNQRLAFLSLQRLGIVAGIGRTLDGGFLKSLAKISKG
jgi:hypothetical protein